MDRSNHVYSFTLSTDKTDTEIVIVRVIFAIDATIAFLQISQYGFGMLIAGILLSLISYFVVVLSEKIKIHYLLLAGIFFMCLLTWSLYFLLIVVLYEAMKRLMNKNTGIALSNSELVITYPFSVKKYRWQQIQFIVLKDGLLTIQFTNNRFFQNEVDWNRDEFGQDEFNRFCDGLTVVENR